MNGSRQLIAIFLVVAAASLAPVGDLFAKLLAVSYGAIFICFGRYLAGGAFGLGVLILSQRFRLPPLTDMPGQFLRAAIAACSIICLIGALKHAPLADVMAGFYLAPVISTGLSATLLGERLGLVKSIGTGLALFGVIAILGPPGAFNLGGALAILSGVLFALLPDCSENGVGSRRSAKRGSDPVPDGGSVHSAIGAIRRRNSPILADYRPVCADWYDFNYLSGGDIDCASLGCGVDAGAVFLCCACVFSRPWRRGPK